MPKIKSFEVAQGPWMTVIALTECGQLFKKQVDGSDEWKCISHDLPVDD